MRPSRLRYRTLAPASAMWIPQSQNSSLRLEGTSSVYLGEDELLLSTLSVTGGATAANFKTVQTYCPPCACDFYTIDGPPGTCSVKDIIVFIGEFD